MHHIFKKIFIFLLLIASLHPNAGYGQIVTQDVLYLNDSSIIRGTIINQSVDSMIKIEIIGGSVLIINKSKVLRVSREPVVEYGIEPFHLEEKGYSNYTELGTMIGESSGVFIETVNGYRFKKYFFAGAGIGVDLTDVAVFKIFSNGRWELLNKRATPYLFTNAGYGFPIDTHPGNIYYNETKYHGGIIYSAGTGMRFKFYGDGSFLLSIGYKHGNLYSNHSSKSEGAYEQLIMSLGISF